MKQGAFVKILSWVLIVLVLVAAIGAISYFTGGFTGEFKTFYLNVDGKDILSTASGYQMDKNEPLTVNVKYTFAGEEVSGYSVRVVPNVISGKDFDFTIDGEPYSFQAERDLTAGFDIEQSDNLFTIKPKGSLGEVMAAVYPENVVGDCTNSGYDNMFLLVVDSYNGESTVTIAFTIKEGVTGIKLEPEHIYF